MPRKRIRTRRRSRLLLIYEVTVLLLFVLTLLINTYLTNAEEHTTRLNIQQNLRVLFESLETEMLYMKEQVDAIAYDSKVNLFNMLNADKVGTDVWLDDIRSIRWYLSAVQKSNATLKRVALVMPARSKVVSSQLLNAELMEKDRLLVERMSTGTVTAENGSLYYASFLQSGNARGALVLSEIDGARLLKKIVSIRGVERWEGVSYALALGDAAIATYGEGIPFEEFAPTDEWLPYREGWAYAIELGIPLDAEGNAVTVKMYFPRNVLHGVTYFRYWMWLGIQALLSLAMLVLFRQIEKRQIERPILEMLGRYDQLIAESGQLVDEVFPQDIDNNAAWHGEIEIVSRRFTDLMNKYRQSISREYQLKIHAQQSELNHLQKQIHPHFLYNCFYNIYRMCQLGDTDRTGAFAMLLANYYAYITRDAGDENVFLREEIAHARNYVEIQKERFGGRIKVEFSQPDEQFAEIRVPKLILQPVIENIFKYVVEGEGTARSVRIRVQSERIGDELVLYVEDDGTVLNDEQLEALRSSLLEGKFRASSTGLLNVKRRLELSVNGRMDIRRSDMGGLLVEIRIGLEDAHD